MKLLIINASGRENNNTRIVVSRIEEVAFTIYEDIQIIELFNIQKEFNHIKEVVIHSQVILWVVPEYNKSFTSVMKYLCEELSVEIFQKKICGVISTSAGVSSRAGLQQSIGLLNSMESIVVPPGIEWNLITKELQDIPSTVLTLLSNMHYFGVKLI